MLTNQQGVEVVAISDQNSTDLDKSIAMVTERMKHIEDDYIICVVGGIGGRLDQTFATFNSVYKNASKAIVLIAPRHVTILLLPGRNFIDVSFEKFNSACGIIPLAGPAVLSTKGLQYNMGWQIC